jgi:hydroxymethylpyrimidine/phosphomethylpyrimidine kinase
LGVAEAIKACGGVPDIIYDLGGVGKEAMVRVLGRDPLHVAQKVLAIRRYLGLL